LVIAAAVRARPSLIQLAFHNRRISMGILAWLGLGLVAGFLASLLVNKKGEGMFMDIVLGVVGAVVGGFIAHFAGFSGITGFDIYSMLIAVGGAIVVLVVYHALSRRTA
jgi:uncharacterized membrane protein YeaQ/YmgE (transglycosylase-associated protein family)